MLRFIALILSLMVLTACGSVPEPEADAASVTEALTTTDVDIWADPSLLPPPPGFTGVYGIRQDPAHQTPLFLFFNVSPSLGLGRQYFSTTHTAQGQLTPSEWTGLTQALQAGQDQGLSIKVRITYSNEYGDPDPTKLWFLLNVYQCLGHGVQFGTECGGPRFPMNRFWDPTNVMLGYECTTSTGLNGTMVSKCATIPSTCGFLYCVAN